MPFGTAVKAWFLISLQAFGGPAGQIAVMHRTLVEEKRRIGAKRFLHALNSCMLLPGPEARQLATYVGWLLNGTLGGLAGTLFVIPGAIALLACPRSTSPTDPTTVVAALFAGLAPAVLAIVASITHLTTSQTRHDPHQCRAPAQTRHPPDRNAPGRDWHPAAAAGTHLPPLRH